VFDNSIKTPKIPIIKRLGYFSAACLLIGFVFWVIGSLASLLLQALAPQAVPEAIEQYAPPLNQPIEVMIEVDDSQGSEDAQ
jgi:hypothetical protein